MTVLSSSDSRPLVVFLCDSLPPYRVRIHTRILREVPEIRLFTLCTHDPQSGTWPAVPQEVLPHLSFSEALSGSQLAGRRAQAREWKKGGRIVAWLKENKPAAVVVNGYNDPARLRVLAWCYRNAVPAFIHADSNIRIDNPEGIRKLIKRPFLDLVLRRVFGVFAFGSLGFAYFRRYGVPADRIFTVPLEPDYDRIESLSPALIEETRQQFGLSKQRKRILFSGRLSPEKRVDLLIRAFLAIADHRPEWDLVLLGDGPLRQELEALVPTELRSRFVWTGVYREPDKIFSVYANCDVLVLPSDHDKWALVINEATASGLAIICSNVVGSTPELVQEGVNGLLFRPRDLGGLATALREITQPAFLEKYKAGSKRVIAAWRAKGDPVAGFRKAMQAAGVLEKV